MRRVSIFLGCFLLATSVYASEPVLRLFAFEAPPYQSISTPYSRSTPGGSAVKTIECALDAIDWKADITVVPKRRGLHALRRQAIDGLFSLARLPGPSLNAQSTDPIALRKWYFFSTNDDPGREDQRIGVLSWSDESRWLDAERVLIDMDLEEYAASHPER